MQPSASKLASNTPDEGQVGLLCEEEEEEALHADRRHLQVENRP